MINMENAAADDMARAINSSPPAISVENITVKPLTEEAAKAKMVTMFREAFANNLPCTKDELLAANISPEQIHELLPQARAIAEGMCNIA